MSLLVQIFLFAQMINAEAFIEQFTSDRLNYSKCCDVTQKLSFEWNEQLSCSNFENNNISFITNVVSTFPNKCIECIDFLCANGDCDLVKVNCGRKEFDYVEHLQYPKCCPLNSHFNTFEHKCVQNEIRDTKHPKNFVSKFSGMANCPLGTHVIVVHDNFIDANLLPNGVLELSNTKYEYGMYCMDTLPSSEPVIRTCDLLDDVCSDEGLLCLKKCCRDGFAYNISRKCAPFYKSGINVNDTGLRLDISSDVDFAILSIPQQKKYLAQQKHHFYIDKYGNMHVREGIEKRRRVYTAKSAHYCIETIVAGNSTRQEFFLLFKNQSKMTQYKFITTATCLLISCFFLLLTFIGYLVIPDMLNLFGKTVVCYTFITFCGFSVLAWVQINNDMPHNWCTTFGFLIQFSFLASFAWLNVICYDMWTVFGTFSTRAFGKSHEWRRFFFYNLYAWTVPTVFTALVLWAFFSENTPAAIKPHIGKEKCFYNGESDYAHIVFFSIPVALCILANSVMFMKTIMYYTKVKNEIEKMKDQTGKDAMKRRSFFQTDTDRMITLLKLFVIMGLFWLFEVISNFISFKENIVMEIIEFIMDTFTSLQGLFIFCIFMVKKKVAAKLLRKFRRYEVRSVRSSSSTRTTALLSQDARLTFDMRQSTSTKQ